MLDYLIAKYKDGRKDKEQIVYRLSYAGRFIIVKGKTLCGSLIIINNAYKQYAADMKRFDGHLYKHLFDHLQASEGVGRFRIRTLARVNVRTSQYDILKREQMELDRHRYDYRCLNNTIEAFIPQYNEETRMYGWLDRSAVLNFKRWLGSKAHADYVKKYSKKRPFSKMIYDKSKN